MRVDRPRFLEMKVGLHELKLFMFCIRHGLALDLRCYLFKVLVT